jgi:hypothetical protein
MDWSHTKKRGWRNTESCFTMESSGKQEGRKTNEKLDEIGYQRSG